jgi:N-sulfoglucosamine sulfohydrolase
MPSRRQFLAAGSAAWSVMAQARPRNILFLIADDLGLHTGAYGDPNARTPNLDGLAAEGVRFTHAFATTASCSPSRSVMLSGLHTHANGQYGLAHAAHNQSYLPSIRALPELLREAGYRTGIIGKLHVNPLSAFPWDLKSEGAARNVAAMAEQARRFLAGAGDRPWYLHVGYADPHRDATGFANRDYEGVYRHPVNPAQLRVPGFLPDFPEVRGELAEYYESANRMDQGVGMMLNLLRETKQLDNTLIVFISDNGIPFPNAKTNCYEASLRLPLIVRAPGGPRGAVNHAMVTWADLTPTFLDWAGVKPPAYPLHGRSFLPVLGQENPAGWDEAFFSHQFHEITMYYPMRGLRTRQYRYINNLFPELEYPHASDLWNSKTWQSVLRAGPAAKLGKRPVSAYLRRPAEELYDVTADPDEVVNLAASPKHRDTLLSLRQKVLDWRKRTGDPWMILERSKR